MNIRTQETIKSMDALLAPSSIHEQVLSQDEMSYLRNVYLTYSEDPQWTIERNRSIHTRKNRIVNLPKHEWAPIIDIIMNHASDLDRNCIFDEVRFYRIERPYHLHSDTGKNDEVAYRQGVVPIEICPSDVSTYTLIFNQRIYYSSELVHPSFNAPPDYKPFYNIPVYNSSDYQGWEDAQLISDSDSKKYWFDKWKYFRKVYHGFSIETEYKWRVGDILTFDRTRAHAATLLEQAGIDYKVGLLFLTSMPN